MRVLVTGGSGFIGRRAVAELTADGAEVRVVDLKPHPDPAVETVVGDIADPAVLQQAFDGGFDSVVHLAAVTSVLRSIEQPELTYQTNIHGTHRVLEAAKAAGVSSLAFASTNAVTGPMEEPAITERARLRPMTPYGATKAAGEMMMSAYTAVYGVRCTALRLTNVYGLGMYAKDSIVARLMRAIQTGATFEIYGDGKQVRDYVNVSDVVAAVRLALLTEEWSGPVVIGTGTSLSVKHGPAKEGEMPAVIVDPSRAKAAGWSPQWDFTEGIQAVWQEWSAAAAEGAEGAVALPGGGR
jgi:UDP-glucose 4-epimerase